MVTILLLQRGIAKSKSDKSKKRNGGKKEEERSRVLLLLLLLLLFVLSFAAFDPRRRTSNLLNDSFEALPVGLRGLCDIEYFPCF